MMLTLGEVVQAIKGRPAHVNGSKPISGVSIDSRTIQKEELFFAIRGPRFDGHRFLEEVWRKGAGACVIDEKGEEALGAFSPGPRIVVQDTDKALRDLARAWRLRHNVSVVAITGSCGKTTTKEFTHAALARRFSVLSTRGNYNNQYGLPLTLFRLDSTHQVILTELGANHPGEIRTLCETLCPQIGVITNVGQAHLEGFGDLEGVYRAKLELGEFLAGKKGALVVNGDDSRLISLTKALPLSRITFGRRPDCDFAITRIEQDGDQIRFEVNRRHTFQLVTYASFNVYNILAGLCVAHLLGLPIGELSEVVRQFSPPAGRFEVKKIGPFTFVFDAYNANPTSFREALTAFCQIPCEGHRVVVCGDMRELGPESRKLHEKLGETLAECGIDGVVTVGELAAIAGEVFQKKKSANWVQFCKDNSQVVDYLKAQLAEGDTVLLKGSRAMLLGHVLEAFLKLDLVT